MLDKKERYVKVRFTSNRDDRYSVNDDYTYFDKLKTPLKPFDVVLVPTRYGYTIAVVTEVGVDNNFAGGIKEVAELLKSKVLDEEFKAERAKVIKTKLNKKLKELDELKRYKAYTDSNPEIAALVKELEEVTNG